MPELPEVETTVRGLRKHIVGKTIISAWTDSVRPTKSMDGMSWAKRKKLIEGKKIHSVTRRAKYIVINFKNGGDLYIHQKMTGHLLVGKWRKTNDEWRSIEKGVMEDGKNQHIRAVFTLNSRPVPSHSADRQKRGRAWSGTSPKTKTVFGFALSDMRRFATITYVKNPADYEHLNKLGPEPLDITLASFHKLFGKKKGVLKPTLMDPYFIAGIGNIYADEILWASGLHPLSRVESLKEKDREMILKNTKTILTKAIKMGGSSVDDYRTSTGEAGEFQNILNAYQRTGEKCKKGDGGTIQRIVVGQRSTHFCSVHQRKR